MTGCPLQNGSGLDIQLFQGEVNRPRRVLIFIFGLRQHFDELCSFRNECTNCVTVDLFYHDEFSFRW